MTLSFSCECGQALQARDEFAGRPTRCPACGRDLIIGGPAAAPPVPVVEVVVPPPRRPDTGRPAPGPKVSGKAVAGLVLGLLTFCFGVFAAVPAFILAALGLRDIRRSEGRLTGRWMAFAGMAAGLLGIAFHVVLTAAVGYLVVEGAGRAQSQQNLRRLGLALHSYHDAFGCFPPPGGAPPQGPGTVHRLSWRVHLLPMLGEQRLFEQFHLHEPWDSPHNLKLLDRMPAVYAPPRWKGSAPPGHTYYRVFVGSGAAFESASPVRLADITDGSSNTFLVVEAGEAVPWTRPDELRYVPAGPLPKLGGLFGGDFHALFADGGVRLIPKGTNETTLRASITRSGGEVNSLRSH